MEKHTPGPWRVCGGYTPHYIAIAAGGELIVDSFAEDGYCRNSKCVSWEEQRANARLIAAAPELLKICKIIQAEFNRLPNIAEVFAEEKCFLDSVIAQAEGELK
jgi:hypothetical protein